MVEEGTKTEGKASSKCVTARQEDKGRPAPHCLRLASQPWDVGRGLRMQVPRCYDTQLDKVQLSQSKPCLSVLAESDSAKETCYK